MIADLPGMPSHTLGPRVLSVACKPSGKCTCSWTVADAQAETAAVEAVVDAAVPDEAANAAKAIEVELMNTAARNIRPVATYWNVKYWPAPV